MGNNECRLLGVSPERTIDVSLFLALWKTYRHLGEDGTRYLSRGNAKKFMKDLAAAWDIPYCPQTAECILARVAPQKTARLGFHAFKHLFAEAFEKALEAPNTRISSRNLSPELRQQLPQLRPEDWTALPIEVWCHVVSFLDRKSSSNLSLSCSLLRDVCISTQTRFSVSPFCLPHYGAMSSVLQRLVQNCPRLRHLSLRGCMFLNDEDLKLLPDTLLTLDLSHCQTITGNALRYIPPQLSCLSLAHCYGLRSLDLIFLPRRLQKLNIAGFVLENGWWLHLPDTLCYLDISETTIDEAQWQRMQSKLPTGLRVVIAIDCPSLPDKLSPHHTGFSTVRFVQHDTSEISL